MIQIKGWQYLVLLCSMLAHNKYNNLHITSAPKKNYGKFALHLNIKKNKNYIRIKLYK